jgi:hypothetical protein
MKLKPNELYGRVVELGALARTELRLEQFLSSLAARLRLHPSAGVAPARLIADLAVSARVPSRFLTGGLPADVDGPLDGSSSEKAITLELLEGQVADLVSLRAAGAFDGNQQNSSMMAASGRRWDNVDIASFLDGAAVAFQAMHPEQEIDLLEWPTVAAFLRSGQRFE